MTPWMSDGAKDGGRWLHSRTRGWYRCREQMGSARMCVPSTVTVFHQVQVYGLQLRNGHLQIARGHVSH